MITTTTKHIITVTEKTLFSNLANRFIDILNDCTDDPEIFTIEVSRLNDIIENVSHGNWSSVFNDGYTPVVMPNEEMEYIEDFGRGKKGDGVLEINIKVADGKNQIIPWDLVQY